MCCNTFSTALARCGWSISMAWMRLTSEGAMAPGACRRTWGEAAGRQVGGTGLSYRWANHKSGCILVLRKFVRMSPGAALLRPCSQATASCQAARNCQPPALLWLPSHCPRPGRETAPTPCSALLRQPIHCRRPDHEKAPTPLPWQHSHCRRPGHEKAPTPCSAWKAQTLPP